MISPLLHQSPGAPLSNDLPFQVCNSYLNWLHDPCFEIHALNHIGIWRDQVRVFSKFAGRECAKCTCGRCGQHHGDHEACGWLLRL